MSTKIHLLTDDSRITTYSIIPLLYNNKEIRKRGFHLKFYNHIHRNIFNCEVLIIFSKAIFDIYGEKDQILPETSKTVSFLQLARKKVKMIIWHDCADSTTSTHFEILPYVDRYLKKFLFKDFELYKKTFYGGRVFTDFYHKAFRVEDTDNNYASCPLNSDQYHKLKLSWGIGLGKMYNAFGFTEKVIRKFRRPLTKVYNIPENSEIKNIDIFLKTTANLSRNTVKFHRQTMVTYAQNICKRNDLDCIVNGPRLPAKVFRECMAKSKIMPSPFGWGEIGVRDYEAFIYRSLLLKPSMEHLVTFPDIFHANVTYVPIKWDFSDMEDKILYFLHNSDERAMISLNGNKAYKDSISKKGQQLFINHFIKLIEN